MKVTNRDGSTELVDFNKITRRLEILINGYDENGMSIGLILTIDPIEISKEICRFISDGIPTTRLDEEASGYCASRIHEHPDYDVLATRIIISNFHKRTRAYKNFSVVMNALHDNQNEQNQPAPMVSDQFHTIIMKYADRLNAVTNELSTNDYRYLNYFGFKTLVKSYLLRSKRNPDIQESFQ